MTIELAGQVATIAAIIGLGVWNDRSIVRFYRKIGERLDLIDARLAALDAKSNGADPLAHLMPDIRGQTRTM